MSGMMQRFGVGEVREWLAELHAARGRSVSGPELDTMSVAWHRGLSDLNRDEVIRAFDRLAKMDERYFPTVGRVRAMAYADRPKIDPAAGVEDAYGTCRHCGRSYDHHRVIMADGVERTSRSRIRHTTECPCKDAEREWMAFYGQRYADEVPV